MQLIDEAIKLGYVNADLIDQKIETSNESFEYIEENNVKISENFNYNKNIKFGVKVQLYEIDYLKLKDTIQLVGFYYLFVYVEIKIAYAKNNFLLNYTRILSYFLI